MENEDNNNELQLTVMIMEKIRGLAALGTAFQSSLKGLSKL